MQFIYNSSEAWRNSAWGRVELSVWVHILENEYLVFQASVDAASLHRDKVACPKPADIRGAAGCVLVVIMPNILGK